MTQVELDEARDAVLELIKADDKAQPMELALATVGVTILHGLLTDLKRGADALERIADDYERRTAAQLGLTDASAQGLQPGTFVDEDGA